jgi:hypothetical protein
MKGIVNKGLQEMIEASYGAQTWEKTKSLAGCEEPFFAVSLDYPDEMTLALVQAACQVSGLPAQTLMVEYGRFVVPHTLRQHYPTYFALAGSSPREFLLNMDRVHEQTTTSVMNSTPPRFDYEELPDGRLLMHYNSKRRLCAVLHGLILGVGLLFNQDLQVQETSCMHKGGQRCTMAVTFP